MDSMTREWFTVILTFPGPLPSTALPSLCHTMDGTGYPLAPQSRVTSSPSYACKAPWGSVSNWGRTGEEEGLVLDVATTRLNISYVRSSKTGQTCLGCLGNSDGGLGESHSVPRGTRVFSEVRTSQHCDEEGTVVISNQIVPRSKEEERVIVEEPCDLRCWRPIGLTVEGEGGANGGGDVFRHGNEIGETI